MVITFDPNKDKLNRRKHGISLSAADRFDWENAMIWPDLRYHYSELRECALGFIGSCLFFVAFIQQGDVIRVISLRRTNKGEEKHYAFPKT